MSEAKVYEEAGRVLAERMLEVTRMAAKRDIVRRLYERAEYAAEHTTDNPIMKAHYEFMAAELLSVLDNPINWRTL